MCEHCVYKSLHTITKFKTQRLSLSAAATAALVWCGNTARSLLPMLPQFRSTAVLQRTVRREREKAKAKAQRQSVGAQNIGVAFVVLICVCVPNVFGLYVLCVLAPATKEIKYIFLNIIYADFVFYLCSACKLLTVKLQFVPCHRLRRLLFSASCPVRRRRILKLGKVRRRVSVCVFV